MIKKHFFKILLGFALSTILIYLTFRNVNFSEIYSIAKESAYWLLIPAALLYACTYILRSIRYYFMIYPIKKTKHVLTNFPYTMMGFFMNNIIPLRLGELIRAKITGERLHISRSSILGSIVLERLVDVIVFVLFFFFILYFVSFSENIENIKSWFFIAGTIFGVILILLFLISKNEETFVKLFSKLPMPAKIKNIVIEIVDKFADGLVMLKKPAIFLITILFSLLIWITESSVLLIVAYACGVNTLGLLQGIFIVIVIGIGAIVPTAPGYIGAFEYFGSKIAIPALALGIPEATAVACILLYHFVQIIVIFSLGFGSMLKTKISFSDLFKFAKIEDEKN